MNYIDPNKVIPLPQDDLDRLLDSGLAKYAKVEPRAGLEERILANLRSEQPVAYAWWRWGFVAAVAAILFVLALGLRSFRSRPAVADHPRSTPAHNPAQSIATLEVRPTSGESGGNRQQHPTLTAHALRHKARVPEQPKLDTFPSRQALSAEEIALARYAKNFPAEAQLVAHAQEEFAIESEKEMNDAGSETRPSTTIQQER